MLLMWFLVGTLDAVLNALGQLAEFVGKGVFPCGFLLQLLDELPVIHRGTPVGIRVPVKVFQHAVVAAGWLTLLTWCAQNLL